ncbi:Surfeit locus protein 6 [Carpediemonas membranifera]|uniref:Surfeit locus protein 6 n=1 Tax=Carpediemonas membranifera TaxID=201153 RepID=A0A8J6AWQ9_9EUKA|nr:Surfeit locus protein 6 [Carpediemonas membranifera]|eukprot:KAG9394400.1 Surfeit locus protein 6 [Carpediemonas membranifera]
MAKVDAQTSEVTNKWFAEDVVFFSGLCNMISQRYSTSKTIMSFPMKKAEKIELKRGSMAAQLSIEPKFPTAGLTLSNVAEARPAAMKTLKPAAKKHETAAPVAPLPPAPQEPKDRKGKNLDSKRQRKKEVAKEKAKGDAKEKPDKASKRPEAKKATKPAHEPETKRVEQTEEAGPGPVDDDSGILIPEVTKLKRVQRHQKKDNAATELAKLSAQKQLLDKMKGSKRQTAEHNLEMEKAARRLSGAKVHDDETRLKASLKRDQARKRKATQSWNEREKAEAEAQLGKRPKKEAVRKNQVAEPEEEAPRMTRRAAKERKGFEGGKGRQRKLINKK